VLPLHLFMATLPTTRWLADIMITPLIFNMPRAMIRARSMPNTRFTPRFSFASLPELFPAIHSLPALLKKKYSDFPHATGQPARITT
jgi:hypothetical protein